MFLRNDDMAYYVRALVKLNGTIKFLDHKTVDLDTKVSIPKCFSSKGMVETVFLQHGCQRKVLAYVSCTKCS